MWEGGYVVAEDDTGKIGEVHGWFINRIMKD